MECPNSTRFDEDRLCFLTSTAGRDPQRVGALPVEAEGNDAIDDYLPRDSVRTDSGRSA